jgi:hypothetical protein
MLPIAVTWVIRSGKSGARAQQLIGSTVQLPFIAMVRVSGRHHLASM